MRRHEPAPPFRRSKIFAFDPTISLDIQTSVMNEAIVKLPWEELKPGPVGEYVEVIDYDPSSGGFYEPVDLNDASLLVQDGLSPSEGNPKFHQQMVYAVSMITIRNFERALGRRVLWAPNNDAGLEQKDRFVERLRIYPHALREANAFYSPNKVALLFGYFRASYRNPGRNLPGGMVFTCLSHDIIAHETAHAVLDGMHRRFLEASNVDSLAFHEAFSDIVALFQHFTFPEAVKQQITQLRGDLSQRSLLSGLARQFGEAIGHYGALRESIEEGSPDPAKYETTFEAHARGAILVAAVFDAFVSIYRNRVADLLRLSTGDGRNFPEKDLHPDLVNRLTHEATKVAGQILRICIRALDYLPPIDVTFGDYLRAMITADMDLVANDDRGYRLAIVEAFRRRGIYPKECRSLSVENLIWERPDEQFQLGWLRTRIFGYKRTRLEVFKDTLLKRQSLTKWLSESASSDEGDKLIRKMGLALRGSAPKSIRRSTKDNLPEFEVQSLRVAQRVGPDGDIEPQIVIEITQERDGYRDLGHQEVADKQGTVPGIQPDFMFRGGTTIIADLRSREVRHCIVKDILSDERLEYQRKFMFGSVGESLRATYFGGRGKEPFALLHRTR